MFFRQGGRTAVAALALHGLRPYPVSQWLSVSRGFEPDKDAGKPLLSKRVAITY